jgi:hypothetical protein
MPPEPAPIEQRTRTATTHDAADQIDQDIALVGAVGEHRAEMGVLAPSAGRVKS